MCTHVYHVEGREQLSNNRFLFTVEMHKAQLLKFSLGDRIIDAAMDTLPVNDHGLISWCIQSLQI